MNKQTYKRSLISRILLNLDNLVDYQLLINHPGCFIQTESGLKRMTVEGLEALAHITKRAFDLNLCLKRRKIYE